MIWLWLAPDQPDWRRPFMAPRTDFTRCLSNAKLRADRRDAVRELKTISAFQRASAARTWPGVRLRRRGVLAQKFSRLRKSEKFGSKDRPASSRWPTAPKSAP